MNYDLALFNACRYGDVVKAAACPKSIDVNKAYYNHYDGKTSHNGIALLVAVTYKHQEVLKILLARDDLNLEVVDKDGNTALHIACQNGSTESVEILLQDRRMSSEIINKQNSEGMTALMKATIENTEAMKMLLARYEINLAVTDKDGDTALHIACQKGSSEAVDLLLQDSRMTSDIINKHNNVGKVAIMDVTTNNPECLKMLLSSNKIDLAVTDKDGNTVLHTACSSGFLVLVEYLVKDRRMTKEILNRENRYGTTPLQKILECYYSDKSHKHTMEMLLLGNEVNLAGTDRDGNSALHKACKVGSSVHVDLLLQDARMTTELFNKRNSDGDTALIIASEFHPNLIKSLLDREDLDLAVTNTYNNTALKQLCYRGAPKPKYLDLLLYDSRMTAKTINKWSTDESSVLIDALNNQDCDIIAKLFAIDDLDVEAADEEGDTPLHLACFTNDINLIKLIGQHKKMTPDMLNKKNDNGDSALMMAVKDGHLSCVKELGKLDGLDWGTVNKRGKSLVAVARNFNHSDVALYLEQIPAREVLVIASPVKTVSAKLLDFAKSVKALEAENAILVLEQEEKKHLLNQKQSMELTQLKRDHELAQHSLKETQEDALAQQQNKMKDMQTKIQTLVSSSVESTQPPTPECPVCLDNMPPPTQIYNCPNGHLVCSRCKATVTKCSICLEPIMGRATAMEQMLRNLFKIY